MHHNCRIKIWFSCIQHPANNLLQLCSGVMQCKPSAKYWTMYPAEIVPKLSNEQFIFKTSFQKRLIDSSSKEGYKPDKLKGEIEFRNIHFSYPSRPDITVSVHFRCTCCTEILQPTSKILSLILLLFFFFSYAECVPILRGCELKGGGRGGRKSIMSKDKAVYLLLLATCAGQS